MFSHALYISSVLAAVVHGQVSDNCTAFSSGGIVAANYEYYRFYDFRNIKSSPKPVPSKTHPRNRTVTDGTWGNDWFIRNFPRNSPGGTVLPVNFTPKRVFISNSTDNAADHSSYLTLSTARISKKNQEAGEITFQEFQATYASIRVYGRVRGAPGGVAGIFTYQNDTQESDIEVFTRTPTNYINYSNQPASSGEPNWIPIPGASVNRTLPIGLSYADWHVHRLDWTKDRTVFFVDNTVVNTTTLNVPVITPPSKIYLDMWSSASDWTGSMQIGNNASFDIQWVELLFNSTDSIAKAATNNNVCIVDDIYPAPVESPTTQTGKNSQGVHLAALDGRLFGFWFSLFVYNVFFTWRG